MAMGTDPKAAFEKISKELQDKFDECGMGAVDTFVDKLDAIKDKASGGPTALIDNVKELFDAFKANLQKFLDDPSSLAPSSGGMAVCASWYGNAVVGKLGALNDDSAALLESMKKCAADAAEPFKKLADVLNKAMAELEGTLKKLSKLPKEVMALKEVDKPEEVAKIDTAPMKKCLDVGGIDKPLGDLAALKKVFDGVADLIKEGIKKLADFTSGAPDKAPPAMTSLLEQVDKLKKIDLEPVLHMLEDVQETVCKIDVNKVKDPVTKFAKAASSNVDDIDKVVAGAKLASDPAGAAKDLASKVPGMGSLF